MSKANTVKEYKCLNCNAGLEFNPESQNWDCNYCFSRFTKEALDKVYVVDEPTHEEMPELDSYHCTSCGAELLSDNTTSATFCVYCKNPTVIRSRFSGKFKPRFVIPFKMTKEKAKSIYSAWIKKRFFAPSEFKHQEEIEKITGIYAPFWLFDCTADGYIEGDATTVSSWRSGNYRYTKTRFFRVSRAGTMKYDNVPCDASKKLDDKLMHMIEPYSYADLKDFSMQYMSGFMAEKYDVDSNEAGQVIQGRVKQFVETTLKGTVNGYASFSVADSQVNLSDENHDYSMLPVYLLVNKYKGKEHKFMINGQTGKVVGETPISIGKMFAFGGALFAALTVLTIFGGAFFV